MRIGLVLGLAHRDDAPGPRWSDLLAQASTAEAVGFDLVTIPDALTDGPLHFWESMTFAGALAAASSRIGIAHSTINAPMRPPALVARSAHTLDEVSGGRYTLGMGAGNTPNDYRMFGIDADLRYSRFVEALTVVTSLLRTGAVDFDGTFQTAHADSCGPVGPRPLEIPVNVAAGGPKMIALAVRLADQWNWYTDATSGVDQIAALVETVARECEAHERDPATLLRTLDAYSFDPLRATKDPAAYVHTGSIDEMSESLLAFGEIGIDEVRVDIAVVPVDSRIDAIAAMAPVVEAIHAA